MSENDNERNSDRREDECGGELFSSGNLAVCIKCMEKSHYYYYGHIRHDKMMACKIAVRNLCFRKSYGKSLLRICREY